jgi:hypothetical protein
MAVSDSDDDGGAEAKRRGGTEKMAVSDSDDDGGVEGSGLFNGAVAKALRAGAHAHPLLRLLPPSTLADLCGGLRSSPNRTKKCRARDARWLAPCRTKLFESRAEGCFDARATRKRSGGGVFSVGRAAEGGADIWAGCGWHAKVFE